MKKYLLASTLINVSSLILILFLFNKYSIIKTELIFFKQSIGIPKKEKNIVVKIDKTDPIYIYNSKKFSCDTLRDASMGYGICSFEKLKFIEGLLNKTVNDRLDRYNATINRYKEGVLKAKYNSYFVKELKNTTLSQANFIRSQKVWEEMRVLNSEEVSLGCAGSSGCTGITNSAEIKYILERIEKIKRNSLYDF